MILLKQTHKISLFYWHMHLLCWLSLKTVAVWSPEVPSCFCSQTSGFDLQSILPEREFSQLSLAAALDVYKRLYRYAQKECMYSSVFAHPDMHVLEVTYKAAELKPFPRSSSWHALMMP